MGGVSYINVAFGRALSGSFIVADTGSNVPGRQNLEDFVSPEMPKLFIVGENDPIADRPLAMTNLCDSAPKSKEFQGISKPSPWDRVVRYPIYPGNSRGDLRLFRRIPLNLAVLEQETSQVIFKVSSQGFPETNSPFWSDF